MSAHLRIDLDKIEQNVRTVTELCARRNIKVTGVTKVVSGDRRIASVLAKNGIKEFGDVQPSNLAGLAGLGLDRWMMRLPAVSECDEVVANAEGSFHSELFTLQAMERAARKAGKKHKIILMQDLGDLREGFWDEEELKSVAGEIQDKMPHLELRGVGVNLSCFSFVRPDTKKLTRLVELSKSLGIDDPIVSGGNSATIDLMLRDGIPEGVTHLRLGESILFGRERAKYRYLPATHNDAFILSAEVVECREKPSMPQGEIGADSYGHVPVFTDKGPMKRVICSIGKQSIDYETMWPLEYGIEILGASSDHLILDATKYEKSLRAGDKVYFRLGYFATLRAFTSSFVEKEYVSTHYK